MKKTITYLLLWLIAIVAAIPCRHVLLSLLGLENNLDAETAVFCVLAGATGAILYCMRGVYKAWCVDGNWNNRWLPWYFLRPFTGTLTGFAVWLFLRAGLFALQGSNAGSGGNVFLFAALAFLGGLNVKNVLAFLEGIGQKQWGIHPSRGNSDLTSDSKKS